MSNTTQTEAETFFFLTAYEEIRAVAAAEKFLETKLADYDQPAGSDEYDSWEASHLSLDEGSTFDKVTADEILVDCMVSSNSDMFCVTVTLGRNFKALSHDLDDARGSAIADACADAYTQRAESGFRDA